MSRGDFSPAAPVNGPTSNTGQKSEQSGALVDYLTFTVKESALDAIGEWNHRELFFAVFGRTGLSVSDLRPRFWQFYPASANIVDAIGESAGRIGQGREETVCISLSGAGCARVQDWLHVANMLEMIGAKITRLDLAYDDYTGQTLNVHALEQAALRGEFAENGRPPKTSFLSDHGSGAGSTLYVGQKGHKQLCAYEKGKQLGNPESPWVRVEARLYGKHQHVPADALRRPGEFLRGAYSYLQKLLRGACDRCETIKQTVSDSAVAAVTWFRRQAGQTLGVILEAAGVELPEKLRNVISRNGTPGRFRRIPTDRLLANLSESIDLICASGDPRLASKAAPTFDLLRPTFGVIHAC